MDAVPDMTPLCVYCAFVKRPSNLPYTCRRSVRCS